MPVDDFLNVMQGREKEGRYIVFTPILGDSLNNMIEMQISNAIETCLRCQWGSRI